MLLDQILVPIIFSNWYLRGSFSTGLSLELVLQGDPLVQVLDLNRY
jgi:hypothetical protein